MPKSPIRSCDMLIHSQPFECYLPVAHLPVVKPSVLAQCHFGMTLISTKDVRDVFILLLLLLNSYYKYFSLPHESLTSPDQDVKVKGWSRLQTKIWHNLTLSVAEISLWPVDSHRVNLLHLFCILSPACLKSKAPLLIMSLVLRLEIKGQRWHVGAQLAIQKIWPCVNPKRSNVTCPISVFSCWCSECEDVLGLKD